ncbi:MAG: cytochrome P450 [Anaerolineaceae bacterium]|nr:cytochrome P450 [Anaerolineaceae bacterium]
MKPTPPQLSGLPVIGNVMAFSRDRAALIERGYQEKGPIFSIKLVSQNVAVIAGEEAQETFFAKTDTALRMDKAYGALRAMFGDIAFTASPEVYMAQRHILHAPFKGGKMPGYVKVMQKEIQQWLDSLGESGEVDLGLGLAPLVQNVAAHAIMGEPFRKAMGREFWDLYADLNKGMDMIFPPNWPLPKFRRRDAAKAKMQAILKPIIHERRTSTQEYNDMLQDFATATYKDGRPVEDEVIFGLIAALMFAGHETTVGQAAWTVTELLKHPDYLKLVQTEISEKFPYGMPADLNLIANLEHVSWAVNETTRLHPSADTIFRYAEEDTEVEGYTIPKGWLVMLNTKLAHKLPDVWSDAEQFDPLRFAPGREEDKKHKHTITGFGGGMHKCTGMNFANNEMIMITSMLLQQFDLELVSSDVQTTYSLGASRPEGAVVRYKRKPLNTMVTPEVIAQAVAAGCPHITAMQTEGNPSAN